MVIIRHNTHDQGRNIDNACHPQMHIGRRTAQHMAVRKIAKRVAKRSLFARRRDAPLDDALMCILTRRQAQELN
jgi:hypothetical protein